MEIASEHVSSLNALAAYGLSWNNSPGVDVAKYIAKAMKGENLAGYNEPHKYHSGWDMQAVAGDAGIGVTEPMIILKFHKAVILKVGISPATIGKLYFFTPDANTSVSANNARNNFINYVVKLYREILKDRGDTRTVTQPLKFITKDGRVTLGVS